MENQRQLSVLIVEDHRLFSEGLRTLLLSSGRFSIIRQAYTGLQALEAVKAHRPDVILMDVQMPEVDGLRAASLIKRLQPDCRILMLTSFTDPDSVKRALSAGVEGYCSKEINPERLIHVIKMIAAGAIYLDPGVAEFVLRNYFTENDLAPGGQPATLTADPETGENRTQSLQKQADSSLSDNGRTLDLHRNTPVEPAFKSFLAEAHAFQPETSHVLKGRELEILVQIANGHSHEEIAQNLSIRLDWVSAYIRDMLQKLAVDTERDAVKKAIADGAIRTLATAPLAS